MRLQEKRNGQRREQSKERWVLPLLLPPLGPFRQYVDLGASRHTHGAADRDGHRPVPALLLFLLPSMVGLRRASRRVRRRQGRASRLPALGAVLRAPPAAPPVELRRPHGGRHGDVNLSEMPHSGTASRTPPVKSRHWLSSTTARTRLYSRYIACRTNLHPVFLYSSF
jgi:hypothetical protein